MVGAAEDVAASTPNTSAHDARLGSIDVGAVQRFLAAARAAGVEHEVRSHEPERQGSRPAAGPRGGTRHLAAIWGAPLHEVGRATLFSADGAAALVVVPADRKVSAPRLAAVLGAATLRVLRGDRGVGRLGWPPLPGEPGALPALPALFGARGYVEELVLHSPHLVIALGGGRSVRLRPDDYVRLTGARVARFAGSTRLLPDGGMRDESGPGSPARALAPPPVQGAGPQVQAARGIPAGAPAPPPAPGARPEPSERAGPGCPDQPPVRGAGTVWGPGTSSALELRRR